MYLDDLPTELLAHVFLSSSNIPDVLSLASTCRRLRSIYSSSRKLQFLAQAAEEQYGPLDDAIQLVTHNASQPTHIQRHVALSMALITQLIQIGRVAARWEDIYPLKKWKTNYWERRLLTPLERYRFRRALYRLWLYTRAFHNASHPRFSRLHRPVINERAALLHNWNTTELAEIADVHAMLREVLSANVCPSNGTIMQKFRKRYPDPNAQLMFNMHLNYPPAPSSLSFISPLSSSISSHYAPLSSHLSPARGRRFGFHDRSFTTSEGWGDAITHYYTIEDMLKLDPAQILYLKESGCSKIQVESYVKGLGEWFENNGETFGQTVQFVLHERGEVGVDEFVSEVGSGKWGVACAMSSGSSEDSTDASPESSDGEDE